MVQLLTHRAHASSVGPAAPDGRRAQCHDLAAPPVSFLPSQAGSSHPPVAYRMARLSVSPGQAAQGAQRRREDHYPTHDHRPGPARRRPGHHCRAPVRRAAQPGPDRGHPAGRLGDARRAYGRGTLRIAATMTGMPARRVEEVLAVVGMSTSWNWPQWDGHAAPDRRLHRAVGRPAPGARPAPHAASGGPLSRTVRHNPEWDPGG